MRVLHLDVAGSHLGVDTLRNPFDRWTKALREELFAQTGETANGTDY
jgi:hypothetical protein